MSAGAAVRPFFKTLAGPALFIALGTLPIAWSDPSLAAKTAARSLAASAVLLLIIRTQPVAKWLAFGSRLAWLAPLADVAMLTYRLIHSLADTARVTQRAQRMRLGEATWRCRMRSTGFLATQTLPESVRRAKALERALDCRLAGAALKVVS